MLQQVHRDMPDEMVDPVQGLVQRVRQRLGAGQTDDEGAHQARARRHGNTVNLRQVDVGGSAGSLQRGHHGLQVGATCHLRHHAAKPHMQLDAGGHFVGQQLMPANNADPGLVARGLDTDDERAASGHVGELVTLPPSYSRGDLARPAGHKASRSTRADQVRSSPCRALSCSKPSCW